MRKIFTLALCALIFQFAKSQSTISSSYSFSQNDVASFTWPITVDGGSPSNPVIVTIAGNLELTMNQQYFIIGSDNVIINGNNFTVTISSYGDYPGLVKNGENSINGFNSVTITNIKVHNDNSYLENSGGWVGQQGFGTNTTDVIIMNCSSDGQISSFGGGITGSYSYCTVSDSYSSGDNEYYGGGIFGPYSYGNAIRCYSTGNGTGNYGGGIFGLFSSGSALDCYSTGETSSWGGGIYAYGCNGTAQRCYTTGLIKDGAGGIAGSNSTIYISNCYSTGEIMNESGGIGGSSFNGSIDDSYTSGLLSGANAGGVAGPSSSAVINNCWSEQTGTWMDDNASIYLPGTNGLFWTDVNRSSGDVPFKLSAYNRTIYTPATESLPVASLMVSPVGNFQGTYSLIDINSYLPSSYPGITINSVTGAISFSNVGQGTFETSVYYESTDDGSYAINKYILESIGTLPVTWLSFTAKELNKHALLQWSTASEQNSRNFNIQARTNNTDWKNIGSVNAAGNSSSVLSYEFTHTNPVNGINYYRLQQMDLDGRSHYSAIQKLQFGQVENKMSVVYENGSGLISVKTEKAVILSLYTSDGRILWTKSFASGLHSLPVQSLPTGIYILQGEGMNEKIIKK